MFLFSNFSSLKTHVHSFIRFLVYKHFTTPNFTQVQQYEIHAQKLAVMIFKKNYNLNCSQYKKKIENEIYITIMS